MSDFTDQTVRVTAEVYQQLQQVWLVGDERRLLNYMNHTGAQAYELSRKLGLDLAAQWIRMHVEEYQHGQQTGEWGLDTGKFDGNVVCQHIGTINNTDLTNVPRTCIHHSPGGHAWGYGGSGPHDLALDTLNWFCPPSEELGKIECFSGYSSRIAWRLHWDFNRDFIASMPEEGGTIEATVIRDWIEFHRKYTLKF